MLTKCNQEMNTATGDCRLIKKREYRPNWNGANVEIKTIIFGVGLPNCSPNEEILTAYDILNCVTFSERNESSITVTFSKDFLRRIIKSHIHHLTENKII